MTISSKSPFRFSLYIKLWSSVFPANFMWLDIMSSVSRCNIYRHLTLFTGYSLQNVQVEKNIYCIPTNEYLSGTAEFEKSPDTWADVLQHVVELWNKMDHCGFDTNWWWASLQVVMLPKTVICNIKSAWWLLMPWCQFWHQDISNHNDDINQFSIISGNHCIKPNNTKISFIDGWL